MTIRTLAKADYVLRQPLVYIAIGGLTALLYLGVAIGMTRMLSARPLWASLSGSIAAVPFSYFGHRLLTFRSVGRHRDELPRFIVLVIVGLLISALVPEVMVTRWHWPPPIGY